MYAKLIFRNAKRSAKDYLIYIVTLTICVTLFYAFLSISSSYYQPDIGTAYEITAFSDGIKLAVCAITLLLLFLIRYVNSYMLRRKQKEFAVQSIMGMEQKTIGWLFFAETFLMGAISIALEMQGKPYSIYIEDAACFPQAYAAAATMLHTLVEEPKAVILDIGGFTADYLLMKNGEIDLTSCDSLENGVILLYNKVRSKVNSELDLLLDEGDVDAILMGKKTQYPDAAIRLTEQMAQEFINDLFSTLRERMLDLQYCKVVFVGGGAILLKRQIETSGKVGTPFFVPKINANADGYEYLYRIETAGR